MKQVWFTDQKSSTQNFTLFKEGAAKFCHKKVFSQEDDPQKVLPHLV